MRSNARGRFLLLPFLLLAGCHASLFSFQVGKPVGPGLQSPITRSASPSPPAELKNYGKPLTQLVGRERFDKQQIALKVEKSLYRLTVLYRGRPVKSYPIVLGRNPTGDKRYEGDNCTPEGEFVLQNLHPHHSWSKFMLLNYPTAESWQRFNAAKKRGLLPKDATIGGAVGIHGVPGKADEMIDQGLNWTAGCVSLKTADIEELYAVCRKGTHVTILH